MRGLSSTKHCVCWASAALVVVALGCGGSTDSPSGPGGSGGSGGSGASGGTGGSGGSGGSTTGGTGGFGATGGSGGIPDAGEVICSGVVCSPSTLTGISACCTAQNTCGVSFNIGGQPGTCYEPPTFDAGPRLDAGTVVPDPNCASLTVGALTLGGCCMADNTCGFASQFTGCISLEALRMVGLPGINLPEGGPMSCVYPPPRI
jgi:hypothetical protein